MEDNQKCNHNHEKDQKCKHDHEKDHECKHDHEKDHECKHKHNHDHNEHGPDCDHNNDDETSLITLEDEDGTSYNFEIIKTFELNDESYAALIPAEDEENEDLDDDEDEDLVFLKFIYEGEEELLSIIEDDEEYDSVLEAFLKDVPEGFDFE